MIPDTPAARYRRAQELAALCHLADREVNRRLGAALAHTDPWDPGILQIAEARRIAYAAGAAADKGARLAETALRATCTGLTL